MQPIFVVGTMRSGTTLLRLILDSHEHIAIGPESGFMNAVAAVKEIPGWAPGRQWYERFDLDEAAIDAQVAKFYDGIFSAYAQRQGKRRWGDKTPFHVWHLEQMARLFPAARFIGIVRHPAATAMSMRRWDYTLEDSLSKWVRANTEILRRALDLGPERFAICRYEDLVTRPKPVLQALMEFLEEPWSDALLRHGEVQRARHTPAIADGGTRTGDPLDASRMARWRADVSQDDLDLIDKRVPGELLRILGYRVEDPAPLPVHRAGTALGLVPVHGARLTGLPVGKYAAGDFDPRPEVQTSDPDELAHRLAKAERQLARYKARRSTKVKKVLSGARRSGGIAWRKNRLRRAGDASSASLASEATS